MRVLHVIHGLGLGGAERQIRLVARAQARAGADVHVAVRERPPDAEALGACGVTLHTLCARGNHDPRLVGTVASLLRSLRPDVLHSYLTQMDIVGGLAAELAGVPWILGERSQAAAYPPSAKNGLRRVLGRRRAAAVVANSEGGRAYWVAAGVRPDRAVVVPNAVDLDGVASAVAAPLPAGARGRPFVLVAGRLAPEKNLEAAVDVLARVLPLAGAVGLVCGEGPLGSALAERVRAHGAADTVHLVGRRDDLWGLLGRAAACVSLSHFEGRPNVVLEAMAAGCPLVVSDIPAHREFLDPSCALFVPAGQGAGVVDAAAHAVAAVLAGSGSTRERAAVARRRVAEFAPDRVAASLAAVYERAVAGSRGRRVA